MIGGLIASIALRTGMGARTVRIGLAILLLLLAIGAWKLWLSNHDDAVVATRDLQAENTAFKAKARADGVVARQRTKDEGRLRAETRSLQEIDHAPNASDLDRRLARHRCLRAQQAARVERRSPPEC